MRQVKTDNKKKNNNAENAEVSKNKAEESIRKLGEVDKIGEKEYAFLKDIVLDKKSELREQAFLALTNATSRSPVRMKETFKLFHELMPEKDQSQLDEKLFQGFTNAIKILCAKTDNKKGLSQSAEVSAKKIQDYLSNDNYSLKEKEMVIDLLKHMGTTVNNHHLIVDALNKLGTRLAKENLKNEEADEDIIKTIKKINEAKKEIESQSPFPKLPKPRRRGQGGILA